MTKVQRSVFKKKRKVWMGAPRGRAARQPPCRPLPWVRGQQSVAIGSSPFVEIRPCSPLPASLCNTASSTHICREHIRAPLPPKHCKRSSCKRYLCRNKRIDAVIAVLETSATEAAQEARAGRQLGFTGPTPSQRRLATSPTPPHIYRKVQPPAPQLIPASGLKKRADRAKARKTIPPMIVTEEGGR